MKKIREFLPIIFLIFVTIFFFRPVFLGKLPIPVDTIVGLYHPFRDLYAKEYPRGMPFKNFLITDPVRQQYPWKHLAIELGKKLQIPLWNPYSFSGTPLLANFQTGTFYPFNLLFLILPFSTAWSILIMLQPFLGGVFLYCYLSNMKINKIANMLGALVFMFCGFSTAWLEWNTIIHTALWLPLILLSIDKLFYNGKFNKIPLGWAVIFIFSLVSSLFAGHLQTFFYLFIITSAYFLVRWFQYGKKIRSLFIFVLFTVLFLILTAIQWLPTLQFISESARDIDQIDWQSEGWFIPWQHLIQFVAPDFFGNPATLNYWGVWNYGEFIGYVGMLPLIMAILALFFRRDKKTLFFGTLLFISLFFSLPIIFAKIPYLLHIPFLSIAQPTRLLFIMDFSLSVLAALGFDYFFYYRKQIWYPMAFLVVVFAGLWAFLLFGNNMFGFVSGENLLVAKRNLVLPTMLLTVSAAVFLALKFFQKRVRITIIIYIIIVGLTIFDLLRFAEKFTPFPNKEYLFPQTKTIEFLQKNAGIYRIMSIDNRILAPNFSIFYKLQTVEGYDPLYLRRYGELIAASERGKPDISSPFGFNRIITPHNYNSKIIDLLGVKYILSLSNINSPKLRKVFQEGETRVYENINVMPRVFFVEQIYFPKDTQDSMNAIFNKEFDFAKIAVADIKQGDNTKNKKIQVAPGSFSAKMPAGSAEIIFLSENKVIIKTNNTESNGLLVLTDSYYPTWRAKINNDYETPISRIDYNFRGVSVPKGTHTVEFYNTLF